MSTSMSIEQVTAAIINGRFSEDELLDLNRLVVDELKEARRRKNRLAVAALEPGDTVEITGRLRGDAYLGERAKVVQVNRTRVVCRFDGDSRRLTIPASVLTKVE